MPNFQNRATLIFGGNAIDSNTVQGELTAALALDMRAIPGTYRPGDAVAYAVTITNSGASDAVGLSLSENLGAYGAASLLPLEYVAGSARYYVNGERQPDPAAESAGGLTFRDIRVPAGGNAAILYAARANDFAPLGEGASILNASRLDDANSAGTTPPETGAPALPLFAEEAILPEPGPRLALHKELEPARVAPGEEVTYRLILENSGMSAVLPQDSAVVTDSFNPRLAIRSVRFNGTEWSAPANYNYDPNVGLFSTLPGQLQVPAASYTQSPSGRWQTIPGTSTIEITGTLI